MRHSRGMTARRALTGRRFIITRRRWMALALIAPGAATTRSNSIFRRTATCSTTFRPALRNIFSGSIVVRGTISGSQEKYDGTNFARNSRKARNRRRHCSGRGSRLPEKLICGGTRKWPTAWPFKSPTRRSGATRFWNTSGVSVKSQPPLQADPTVKMTLSRCLNRCAGFG